MYNYNLATDFQERYKRYKIAIKSANNVGMNISDVFEDTYKYISLLIK